MSYERTMNTNFRTRSLEGYFNAQSVQIGYTVFKRDFFFDMFESAGLLKEVLIVVPYQSVCIN